MRRTVTQDASRAQTPPNQGQFLDCASPPALSPLSEFYLQANRELPRIQQITGDEISEPFKSLLAHDQDMTSTLEKFHGVRVHLTILRNWQQEDSYFREVVLVLDGSEKPVEFGAIKINLEPFEAEPRQKILEGHLPLGRILSDCAVSYHSNPKSFFIIQADDFIQNTLGVLIGTTLYGRQNILSTPKGETLAEIVEILPP